MNLIDDFHIHTEIPDCLCRSFRRIELKAHIVKLLGKIGNLILIGFTDRKEHTGNICGISDGNSARIPAPVQHKALRRRTNHLVAGGNQALEDCFFSGRSKSQDLSR